jgi:hypothetical protein
MIKKSLILSTFLGLLFMGQSASAFYTAVPGNLLRTASDATVVLVMDDLSRVPVSAAAFAIRYNNNFGLVKTVTLAERGEFNSNLVMNAASSLPSGTVFMYETDQPGIFLIENGYKRLYSTYSGFLNSGNSLSNVQWAGQYTLYPTGAPIQ